MNAMNRRESLKLLGVTAAITAAGGWLPTALAQQPPPPPQGPFVMPPLGYAFDALEPHIDAQTMKLHYEKHHGAYVQKCNELVDKWAELAATPVEKLLADPAAIPLQIQTQAKNNLGGHWNHSFFWEIMAPGGAKEPAGELKAAIDGAFQSVAALKDKMNAAGEARFGAGWVWLVMSKNKLDVATTPNQDTPLEAGARPILGIDVWEHAYYLKYQNRRAEYLKAWWNTVNWTKAEANFRKAKV
jgi:Fe-Mn family superoxide dismutase